jgi:hypothetical protein
MVFTLLGVFVVRGGKNPPQRTPAPLALTPPKPNWQDFHTLLRLVDGTVAFLQPFIMLIAIILACLLNYCKQYLPYAGFFFALDWGVRFVVPYFFGAPCYDVLLRKDPPADAELAAERARLHRKVSMRVVACVMAAHVSALSLYGLLTPSISGKLQKQVFTGSTPLTQHLCYVAVAYFLWDCIACADQGFLFVVHAVSCLAVFSVAMVRPAPYPPPPSPITRGRGALLSAARPPHTTSTPRPPPQKPMLHHMAMVTLLYESSTLFMHARASLIEAKNAEGALFFVANTGFALTFFLSRIVSGLYFCSEWWRAMEEEVPFMHPGGERLVTVRMYQVLCTILSGLNVYWFSLIVKGLLVVKPRKGEEKPAIAAGEEKPKNA